MKKIVDEKAMLTGRSYAEDKPWSCKYCYFWEGKKKGCGIKECYYLIPETKEEIKEKPLMAGNCRNCPYGKHSPCIGYCIAKLYQETVGKRNKREGGVKNGGG